MSQIKIQRCTYKVTNDDGKCQLSKVEISSTDVSEDIEHHQNYGLASNVGSGSGVVVTVNGTKLLLGGNQTKGRPSLGAGEVMVWSTHGQKIYLKSDGTIEMTAPTITINGDLKVNGKIDATGDIKAGDVSVKNHTHSGVESGGSSTGVPS